MAFRAVRYYVSSIPTLLAGVRSRGSVVRLFAGRPRRPVEVRLRNGCRFLVRSLMDLWIIKETCLDRDYERDLPPPGEDWTIVDIGAGLGDFCICAAWGKPNRQIAAFEPFAESFRMLRENLRLNGIGNVQAFPCAVGARSGPMLLQTASGVAVRHSTASADGPGRSPALPVDGITLEEAFHKAGFPHCDLLKVDCEGGEYDIFLQTPAAVLRKVDRIAMEYHDGCTPHSHGELADYLRDSGFSVRLRSNPVHRHLGFITAVRNP
jgi:FkbM family methyltransferase